MILEVTTTNSYMQYGFVFDAQPRVVTNTVQIYIYNANLSTNNVLVNIVDVQVRIIERLSHRIERTPGEQIFAVDASRWGIGMYIVTATDGANSGIIKLLKSSR
jgi:hypothetical protein